MTNARYMMKEFMRLPWRFWRIGAWRQQARYNVSIVRLERSPVKIPYPRRVLLGVCLVFSLNTRADAPNPEAMLPVDCGALYGYVRGDGTFVVPPRFEFAASFEANGLAAVREGGKWGYIDRRGHFVVSLRFEEVNDFYNGRTAVKENGKWGYLDAQGHMAIPAIFDSVRNFAANGLAAFEKDGKKGYVDRAGKIAFTHQFDNAWDFSANNRAKVMREISGEMRFGFIDEKGKIVIPVEFFDINDGLVGSFAANGLAPVGGKNGKVGYIDKEGKVVIPFDFDYAEDFAENGLAVAEKNEKYGYINEEGRFVIAPQFAMAFNFCPSGLAIVIRHAEDLRERWGIINTRGEVLTSWFDDIHGYRNDVSSTCSADGWARVVKNKKWGYVDAQGQVAIAPRFEHAFDFLADGFAPVGIPQTGEDAYVDRRGNLLIPSEVCKRLEAN